MMGAYTLMFADLQGVKPSFDSYDDFSRLAGSILSDTLSPVELDSGLPVRQHFVEWRSCYSFGFVTPSVP